MKERRLDENTPTLETARLVLRRFSMDDCSAFAQIMGDEQANRFLPWFPPKGEAAAAAMLQERYLQFDQSPFGYRYAICLKEDNVPIGYVGLGEGEAHDFGYGLRQAFWHKGIVTEACAAVVDRIKQSGLPFITATHDRENPRSGAVMQKLQMTYCYSYEELWQPKNRMVVFRMYQLNFDGSDRVYEGYRMKYPSFVENLKPSESAK